MTKALNKFEAEAAECGDRAAFWQSASLLLMVWSCGGVPAAGYGPSVAPSLYRAFQKFGSAFRAEVNARAFAA